MYTSLRFSRGRRTQFKTCLERIFTRPQNGSIEIQEPPRLSLGRVLLEDARLGVSSETQRFVRIRMEIVYGSRHSQWIGWRYQNTRFPMLDQIRHASDPCRYDRRPQRHGL